MATITLTRVQGADSQPQTIDPQHVQNVTPSTREGYAFVYLPFGYKIEVQGSVEEIKQLIEDARNTAL
ncbi:hypothetical protein [Spirosoma aerolatum]|uniref:hypothetical protein n=1 Tax=Spirosoma aerolatum TaxID=1211326 RepID=UPI0009AECD2A|nr:hypothetical protein [Spirosoma aerolatum]